MSAEPSSRILEVFARLGYAARGIVYCVVGALALLAASGNGGAVQGSTGALQTLFAQPFGRGVLILIALGLIGFAIWRLIQALLDPDRNGVSWKALATRGGYLIGSAVYFGLAATALNIALRGLGASTSGDAAAQDWTAWLMSQPYGRWITGAIAIGIVVSGIVFIVESWGGAVAKHLQADERSEAWVRVLGRMGYAASGIVFVVTGALLMIAALHSNPAEARGLGGALAAIQAKSYGSALLAIVAAGLFAFGAFGIVQGIYRRIDAPDVRDAENAVSTAAKRLT
jgi:uncharacterized protein DUF1206